MVGWDARHRTTRREDDAANMPQKRAGEGKKSSSSSAKRGKGAAIARANDDIDSDEHDAVVIEPVSTPPSAPDSRRERTRESADGVGESLRMCTGADTAGVSEERLKAILKATMEEALKSRSVQDAVSKSVRDALSTWEANLDARFRSLEQRMDSLPRDAPPQYAGSEVEPAQTIARAPTSNVPTAIADAILLASWFKVKLVVGLDPKSVDEDKRLAFCHYRREPIERYSDVSWRRFAEQDRQLAETIDALHMNQRQTLHSVGKSILSDEHVPAGCIGIARGPLIIPSSTKKYAPSSPVSASAAAAFELQDIALPHPLALDDTKKYETIYFDHVRAAPYRVAKYINDEGEACVDVFGSELFLQSLWVVNTWGWSTRNYLKGLTKELRFPCTFADDHRDAFTVRKDADERRDEVTTQDGEGLPLHLVAMTAYTLEYNMVMKLPTHNIALWRQRRYEACVEAVKEARETGLTRLHIIDAPM